MTPKERDNVVKAMAGLVGQTDVRVMALFRALLRRLVTSRLITPQEGMALVGRCRGAARARCAARDNREPARGRFTAR